MDYLPGDQYYHKASKNKLRFFITINGIYDLANNNGPYPPVQTIVFTIHKYSTRKHIPVKSLNNTLYLNEFDEMIQKYYKKYEKHLIIGSEKIE
jgi:hypothetical protein